MYPWNTMQPSPASPASMVEHYALFFRDGKQDCGWIQKVQKNRLLVTPIRGKELLLPANRVIFFWNPGKHSQNQKLIIEELAQQFAQAEQFAEDLDLELIHELTDEEQTYSLKELIEDFADDPENALQALAFLLSLSKDEFWFKSKRLSYTPRSSKELKIIRTKQVREEKRQRTLKQIQDWVHKLDSEVFLDPQENKGLGNLVKQLESLLIQGLDSPYWKELSPVLNLKNMELSTELRVLRWLKNAGHSISSSRLTLMRAGARAEFSESLHVAAQEISANNSLRNASNSSSCSSSTFSIDSESTRDYDDAFSILEWNAQSLRIALHIADVADVIHKDHPLFKEAENRISSVYALEETLNMFPKELSEDYCSLKAGSPKKVISFIFRIFEQGNWHLEKIESQTVTVKENLSYQEADRRITEGESFWSLLNQCCQNIREKREKEGALILEQKDFDIDISDPEKIIIVARNSKSPANKIVEEMAILANRETGMLFDKHHTPGIYRVQSPYEVVREPAPEETLSMEHIKIEAARFSTEASPHAGLACPYYIQITSPIRRFVDLLCQHQLHTILQKQAPVFDQESMMRWAEQSGMRQRQYNKATRAIVQYWKLTYLSQHLKEVFSAKIRKQWRENKTEVELLEVGCRFYASGFSQYEEGKQLEVCIHDVDARQAYVDAKPA